MNEKKPSRLIMSNPSTGVERFNLSFHSFRRTFLPPHRCGKAFPLLPWLAGTADARADGGKTGG